MRVNFNALLVDTVIQGNDGAVASLGGAAHTRGSHHGCLIIENDGANEVQPISTLSSLGGNICGSDAICP